MKPRGHMDDRDFPSLDNFGSRKCVCKRCGLVMTDCEPMSGFGEFWHLARPHQTRAKRCANEGKRFHTHNAEVEPFMRKSRRRALKRMGVRA
jgi:hypothetical protein